MVQLEPYVMGSWAYLPGLMEEPTLQNYGFQNNAEDLAEGIETPLEYNGAPLADGVFIRPLYGFFIDDSWSSELLGKVRAKC